MEKNNLRRIPKIKEERNKMSFSFKQYCTFFTCTPVQFSGFPLIHGAQKGRLKIMVLLSLIFQETILVWIFAVHDLSFKKEN